MKKLIIGFPGLSHKDEKGRLEKIVGHFPDHDFKKIEYLGITKNGKTITVPFSIKNFSKGTTIPSGYDQIGVVTSSTGAAVFSHYLTTHPETSINWYIAISPFCKLNSQAISQIGHLYQSQQDLELPGDSRTKRIIPATYLLNLLNLDANSKQVLTTIPQVLTLIGTQDTIIDLDEAKIHHYAIGGHNTNIKRYNAPHGLTPQSTKDAIEFIRKITKP